MSGQRLVVRAGLVGHPVAQSLSPVIHDYWRRRYGFDGCYDLHDSGGTADGVRAIVDEMRGAGYDGLNVTVPHKRDVMALCDHLSEAARVIGAVNCLRFDAGGTVYGDNSDADGFMAALDEVLPARDYARGRVIVLGAGGAARAVVYALRRAGVAEIVVCNRTADRAEKLVRDLGTVGASAGGSTIGSAAWAARERLVREAALVVNTTVLGMAGQEKLTLDVAGLPAGAAVCDIVYKPVITDLLRAAAARGCVTIDGRGMLLHQAAGAFALWTGVRPAVDEGVRDVLC